MSYHKLFDYINEDWGQNPSIHHACYKLISNITSGNPEDFTHLTFNSIYKLTGSELDQKDLIQITQYLSGDRANLLTPRFEYIGEEESFVLSDENSYYAVNEDAIEHPKTGKVIKGVKSDVFMFFELNSTKSDLLTKSSSDGITVIGVTPDTSSLELSSPLTISSERLDVK